MYVQTCGSNQGGRGPLRPVEPYGEMNQSIRKVNILSFPLRLSIFLCYNNNLCSSTRTFECDFSVTIE